MATSGTIRKNFATGYRLQIAWSQDSKDIAGNTSKITAKVQLVSLGAGYNIIASAVKSGELIINGVTYPFTFSANLTGNQTKTLYTKTVTVSHGIDGAKTCTFETNCSIQVTLSGTYYGTVTASGSGEFDPIPRATTPTLFPEAPVLGSQVTIGTPRASPDFTHNLRYAWGKQTGTIAEDVATSTTWTPPLSLAIGIPNGQTGTGVIICDTYQGSELIGSVSVTFTASIPESMTPSITSVSVTGLNAKIGAFVQGQSRLKVVITATGVHGSTIKAYKTGIDGLTYTEGTFISATLTNAGELEITATVTDSRGKTATVTKTVTVLPYSPPIIRACSAYRCDSSGNKDDEGTSLKVEFAFEVSDLGSKNDKSYRIEYKESGASTWSQITTGSTYSYDSSYLNSSALLNADKSYNVRLIVSDYFYAEDKAIRYEIPIPTAFTPLDVHSSGRGVSIGKVAEEADLFDINLPTKFRQPVEFEDTSGIPQFYDSGWVDLPLKTGWSYQYDTDKPQYRKIGNLVYLRGLVDASTSAGTTIGELPTGFRPVGQYNRFPCTLNQKEFANVQVGRNGLITDYTKTTSVSRTFLCLNGISYFAN